jgi:integrase/recombinase XerD
MTMAEIELDYVNSFIDSRGKRRYVFRRKGHKKVTIKGRPGSEEFMANYYALLGTGTKTVPSVIAQAGAARTMPGTIDALAVRLYRHDVFTKGLAEATQAEWRRVIDNFRAFKTPSGHLYGSRSIATIKQDRITDFLDGKTPNSAKLNLKAIRFFIRFAISQGELAHDPCEGIELVKPGKSMGHMTWLEPQIAQYRERWPLGTMARLAIELLLNIAARRYDAHMIGSQHIRDGKLVWRPHKTLRSTVKLLSIRIKPELQAALDAIPDGTRADGVLSFIVQQNGNAFASARTFGSRFADWCDMAGLKPVLCDDGRTRNYRAHGLRKAALRTLAHAGATGAELMAISGHSSLQQVQEYIEEVEQERMADSAITKLVNASKTSE